MHCSLHACTCLSFTKIFKCDSSRGDVFMHMLFQAIHNAQYTMHLFRSSTLSNHRLFQETVYKIYHTYQSSSCASFVNMTTLKAFTTFQIRLDWYRTSCPGSSTPCDGAALRHPVWLLKTLANYAYSQYILSTRNIASSCQKEHCCDTVLATKNWSPISYRSLQFTDAYLDRKNTPHVLGYIYSWLY